jgi:lysylphosphatidylglycerol synthetase-like protein (DUF2156 family)
VLAASASMPGLWRRRLRVVVLVSVATLALYSALLSDLLRVATALVGLGLGVALRRGGRDRTRATPPEARVLVALIVTASAIGPLVAAFAATRVGPLSLLRFVFASPPPDAVAVHQLCADPTMRVDCARLRARLRLHGVGPALASAIPVLLLLAAAQGLRNGRRAAWMAALGINVALAGLGTLLAVATVVSPKQQRLMIGPGHHVHTWLLFLLPLAQPVLIVALLWCRRGLFAVRAPEGTYRHWAGRVALSLLTLSILYVVGSLAVARQYRPVPSARGILHDLPGRFVPPGYLGAFEPTYVPTTAITTLLYEWTGVLFWAVAVAGALATFARARIVTDGSLDRVRELLAAGGGSLSYPVTWSGNSYWFTPDREAAFAYRVINSVAITTGGPIGDRSRRERAFTGFVRHCHDHGWTPCLYAVSAAIAEHAARRGWHRLQIGEEAVLPLGALAFTGKRWQNVRTALNHAARLGITAEWCRYTKAPPALTDQIRAISEQWLAGQGAPEMGFTLGGLPQLVDSDVRLLLAIDTERTVHAVTSWLPIREDGRLVGYTLDLMRRRPQAFNGVMDFLIASAVSTAQAEGLSFISLSGAPLARVDRGERVETPQRALDLLATTLEPIYGFRSLFAFKARFRPTYQPLFLVYPEPLALPRIARAITHAYLPSLGAVQTVGLLARLARGARPTNRRRAPVRSGRTRAHV